jgi:hypothetical protein
MKSIASGQEKLAELIPLSAASSGMMVGERQLQSLESMLCEVIDQRMRMGSMKPCHAQETNLGTYSFFWISTLYLGRKVTSSARDILTSKHAVSHEIWRLWFLGPVHESVVLKPLCKLITDHRDSLLHLSTSQGFNPRRASRPLSEIKLVITWLFALVPSLLATTILDLSPLQDCLELERRVEESWAIAWEKALEIFSTMRLIQRRHDSSRVTIRIRTVYEYLKPRRRNNVNETP